MEVGHVLEQFRVARGEMNRLLPPFSLFPADLRTWLSENELNLIVAHAVQRADHTRIRSDFAPRWEALLASTATAYLLGTFSSNEIAELYGECPIGGSAAIRHFRRCNRTVLEQTIVDILQSCANKQHLTAASWNGSVPPSICESEASARIAHAIEMDSWSVDDD